MFTNLRNRRTRTAPRAQLRVEALEDRWTPAHLGGQVIELPEPASHGLHGIETANETPTAPFPIHNEKITLRVKITIEF